MANKYEQSFLQILHNLRDDVGSALDATPSECTLNENDYSIAIAMKRKGESEIYFHLGSDLGDGYNFGFKFIITERKRITTSIKEKVIAAIDEDHLPHFMIFEGDAQLHVELNDEKISQHNIPMVCALAHAAAKAIKSVVNNNL